jgi:catechol 2,3-dioxygenase-like lactoylglutathione lyase family enzyme
MRFIHTNIATKDWKALADFYIQVFHCRILPQVRKLSGSWLDRATGLPNVKLEGVQLQLPGYDDDGPTLEIFSYQDLQEDSTPSMLNRTGLTHIAFEVDDVDRTLKAALQHGAQPLGPVSKLTVVGVCDLKFVYFRDPEGNIVAIQSRKEWKRQKSIWSSPQKVIRRCRRSAQKPNSNTH